MSLPGLLRVSLLCALLPVLGQAQEAVPPPALAHPAEPDPAPAPSPAEFSLSVHMLGSLLGGTAGALAGGGLGYLLDQPWRICAFWGEGGCVTPDTRGILTGLGVSWGTVLGAYVANRALGSTDGFKSLIVGATVGGLAGIVVGRDFGSRNDPRVEVLAASVPAAVLLGIVSYGTFMARRKPKPQAGVQLRVTMTVTRDGASGVLVGQF